HIGEEPSQHPPDWWNISGPCVSTRRRSRSAAWSVTSTRVGDSVIGSEEAELVRRVRHQQVLRLLVVVEHHPVVLATDAGLLVATERGVRRVLVIAVGPDPAGLNAAPH